LRLFGQDTTFYDLLEAQAEAAHRAALTFHKLTRNFLNMAEYAAQIDRIEKEADELTHQLANRIDATFVTPLDKEDLHALSSALDDVTDLIEAAAARLQLYNLTVPRPDIGPLVGLLVQITEATHDAVSELRQLRRREVMQPLFVRIHEIENESDSAFRLALATLFNAPDPEPLMVMKWKEIYDRVEMAIDKCETVSDIVESVVVKYA